VALFQHFIGLSTIVPKALVLRPLVGPEFPYSRQPHFFGGGFPWVFSNIPGVWLFPGRCNPNFPGGSLKPKNPG